MIERVGDNAYKLKLPADMAVLATFNRGNLNSYVENYFKDPSYLRPNLLEEEEADIDKGILESSLNPNQDLGLIKRRNSKVSKL